MMKLIDNNNLLTNGQAQSLRNQASLPFSFGGFLSLDDILSKLNVDVRIEPGIVCRPVPSWLSEEMAKCHEEKEQARQDPSKKEEFNALCQKLDELGANANFLNTPLRGLYDSNKNEVILYPEEMSQEDNGKCVDELLLSTLAHETMHAYFNRPGHEKFNYIMFIEEPLAEFGMLLYLHETNSQYYSWAYNDVRKKKTCYRFGAGLMDQCISEGALSPTRSNLEDYKNINLPSNYYPTVIANKSLVLPSGISNVLIMGKVELKNYVKRINTIFESGSNIDSDIYSRGWAIEESVPQNSILFIGLNPSYPKSNPGNSGLYKLAGNKYKYFNIPQKIANVCNLGFAHHDIYMVRTKNQKDIIDMEKKFPAFCSAQRKLCDDIVKATQPKVIVIANEHVADLFKVNRPLDYEIGTYLIKINGIDTPVFCSSMLSGVRALDTSSRTRLIWQIQRFLNLPFKDI